MRQVIFSSKNIYLKHAINQREPRCFKYYVKNNLFSKFCWFRKSPYAPCGCASAETTFYCLNQTKTYLRMSMLQEWLEDCATAVPLYGLDAPSNYAVL